MKKKQFATDRKFSLFIIMGILFIFGGIACFGDGEVGLGIGILVFGAAFILIPSFLVPCLYIFDRDGITICYVLVPNERYLWKNVRCVTMGDDSTPSSNPLLDFLFDSVFKINGKTEGKKSFYMEGNVRRTRRTKKLFQKYYNGKMK